MALDIVLTGDTGVPCAWLLWHCTRALLLLCSCQDQTVHHWAIEDLVKNCSGTVILGVV